MGRGGGGVLPDMAYTITYKTPNKKHVYMYVCAAGQGVVSDLPVLNKVYNFGLSLGFWEAAHLPVP